MRCEVVLFEGLNRRGRRILHAMLRNAPMPARAVRSPTGDADILMIYGIGEPTRQKWFRDHVDRGGRAIGWDLGYWGRAWEGPGMMRVTVDAQHPQRLIRDMPPDRFDAWGIDLKDRWNPEGHVVLVGLGRKQVRGTGKRPRQWETETMERIRAIYPNRRIVYRPKKEPDAQLPGCLTIGHGPIEHVIDGASLVVCEHSNAAVDACIAGVPVVCWDGAAAALYGSDLARPVSPSREDRLRFLRNLAWWQWNHTEARDAWRFLTGVIDG